MALDHMGLGSQRKFGTSRMGMSLGESTMVGMNERAIKNSIQEQKRTERLGRRAYRAALRGQDGSAYIKGIDALETMRAINGTSGAGIKMAGADQAGLEKHIGNTRAQIESFNGKSLDGNGRLVSRVQNDGSGLTPEDAKASSNGGEWVDVSGSGDSKTMEQPRLAGGSLSARFGSSIASRELAPREQSVADGAFDDKTFQVPWDTRSRFAKDLLSSDLVQAGDGGAVRRAITRGSKLGLPKSSIMSFLNRGLENQDGTPASRLLSR